jgi:DNA-binding response OmpR family regulator
VELFAGMPVGLLGNMGLLRDDSNQGPFYSDEHLCLDFHKNQAVLDGQMLTLTRKEYGVLALLVEHSGQIVTREALLKLIWGYGPGIRTRTLDMHIRRLRRKLGTYAAQHIETVVGIGYRYQPVQAPRFESQQ